MSTFWTNTIWYVLLGILTLFELIFVIIKAEKRSIVAALYFTIVLHFDNFMHFIHQLPA